MSNRKGETIINKEITVGTEIDSYCTKCRLILNHVVVAMIGDRPQKVECLTCHGQHIYRASEPGSRNKQKSESEEGSSEQLLSEAKSEKTKEKKRGRGKSKRTQEKEQERWEEAIAGKNLTGAKPYLMSDSYQIDDLIEHSKFGMGIVMSVVSSQKMEVLFKDGCKCMIYNFKQ